MPRKRSVPRGDAPSRLYASRVDRGLRRVEVWLPRTLLARLDQLAATLDAQRGTDETRGRSGAVRDAVAEACDARGIGPPEPPEKKEPTDP